MTCRSGARSPPRRARSARRSAGRELAVLDGEPDGEGGPLAHLAVERDGPLMSVHDDRAGDGQALAGTLADVLGGEEGIVEPGANGGGHPRARVGDADRHEVTVAAGSDGDAAEVA